MAARRPPTAMRRSGSNDTTSRIYGGAVGADYRFSPYTLAGFALAGGGTNFSVANGLGCGRSDLFQAGAFIRHTVGAAYLSGALAYGWQDITTDRTVTVAGIDRLRAQFNANAWSGPRRGRLSFCQPVDGGSASRLTPQDSSRPSICRPMPSRPSSAPTPLRSPMAPRSVTASRSELGLRSDKSFAMQDGIFTLRGRAAWAHNFNTDRGIGATFQTLPAHPSSSTARRRRTMLRSSPLPPK